MFPVLGHDSCFEVTSLTSFQNLQCMVLCTNPNVCTHTSTYTPESFLFFFPSHVSIQNLVRGNVRIPETGIPGMSL